MRWLGVVFLFMSLIVITTGCSRNAITVDDEGISRDLFNLALKERLDSHKAINPKTDEKAIRKSVTDELIAEVLLVKEAKSKNVTVSDDEVKKAIDMMRGSKSEKDFDDGMKKSGMSLDLLKKRVKDRLMISKLMTSLIKDDSVTDEEMKDFYTKSQIPFLKPERENVKILQLAGEADAKKTTEDLKKGADFDALAEGLVKSGKAFATDYGWLEPDTLPTKEIGMSMKTAKINAVQGPYKVKDGSYYFYKIKERQPSQVLSFEEVKPQIRNMILTQKRQEIAARIIDTRKKSAKITINTQS